MKNRYLNLPCQASGGGKGCCEEIGDRRWFEHGRGVGYNETGGGIPEKVRKGGVRQGEPSLSDGDHFSAGDDPGDGGLVRHRCRDRDISDLGHRREPFIFRMV